MTDLCGMLSIVETHKIIQWMWVPLTIDMPRYVNADSRLLELTDLLVVKANEFL